VLEHQPYRQSDGGGRKYRGKSKFVFFVHPQSRTRAITKTAIFQNPIIRYENKAREALDAVRWPDGPICLHGGNVDPHRIARIEGKKQRHRPGLHCCDGCEGQFTVTVGMVPLAGLEPARV
jgi:hypothetical protein